jgi:site-specific DNA-methyltransferase (adenine-specific)
VEGSVSDYDAARDSREGYEVGIAEIRRRKIAAGEIVPWVRREVIGDCTLYLGDCLEVLPTLGKVDACITDPPYGIGFKYASHDDTPDGYGEWLWSVLKSAEEICLPGAPVFVWQAMLNVRRFAEWFPREWRLFAAAKNFVQMRPTAMQYAYDPVVVWWVAGGKPWSLGTQSRDFHIANTALLISTPHNIERGHPCPRPLDQVWHVVNQWVRPGSICLDPFMGSGTTGVACAKLGRRFIGIEIEPKYFDIAVRRVEEAYRQTDLFVQMQAPKPVQTGMFDDH